MLDFDVIELLFSKHPAFILYIFVLCIFVYQALWSMAGSIIVASSQALALKSHKILLHKLAEQQSKGVFYSHLFLTICIGIIWGVYLYAKEDLVVASFSSAVWGILGGNFILLALNAIYCLPWQSWKKMPSLHLFYACFLSFVLFWGVGAAAFITIKTGSKIFASLEPADALKLLPATHEQINLAVKSLALLMQNSLAMPILALNIIAIGLCVSSAKSSTWLLWRRKKDDFGRDYYNFGMHFIASSGLLASLSSLFLWGVTFLLVKNTSLGVYANPAMLVIGGILAALLVFSWYSLTKSKTPLRQKIGLYLNNMFTFLLLFAFMLFWAHFLVRLSWANLPPL